MDPTPRALARVMATRDTHLATFDVDLRKQTGQWFLRESIPVEEIIERIGTAEGLREEGGTLRVPLHESDSPAFSGEFLRVAPESGVAQFFDPGGGRIRTMALEDLAHVYPAWRMRFWSSVYLIEEIPPFMHEFQDVSEEPVTTAGSPGGGAPTLPPDAFFEAVRSTLVATKERRRAARRDVFQRMPTGDFLENYGGIDGLVPAGRSVDEYGQQVIELGIPSGHRLHGRSSEEIRAKSNLLPGDEVVIDATAIDALPVEAELFEIADDALELGVYWDSARDRRAEAAFDQDTTASLTVGKLVDDRRHRTIANAIETVDRTEHARKRYAGDVEATFADLPELEPSRTLNRDQRTALERAYAAEEFFCVHTPPWTGARRVVWELLLAAVTGGERVGLFSADATSLDALLEGGSGPSFPVRAGDHEFEIEVVRSGVDRTDANAAVVAMPIHAAAALEDHSLDLAIVDHAARIDVPTGAVPFAKAARVVCLGDPQQGLPPSQDESSGSDLPASIFEHLASRIDGASTALRWQYCMHQAIAQFSDRQFYDGALIHGGRNRTWTIDALAPLDAVHVPADVRATPTGSIYHDGEIDVVVDEVGQLLRRGLDGTDIGVVTPFSGQIGKIRVALNGIESGLGDEVVVGDLDRFRCRRRQAVIVSFVGSGDQGGTARGDGKGLSSSTEMNVALTRAERRLVLVGDWSALAHRAGVHGDLVEFLLDRGILDRSFI